jgi:hypothetical protein
MAVALTLGMSALNLTARNLVTLFAASLALFSVACQGADEPTAYTASDAPGAVIARSTQALQCESGETQSCIIYLGEHGNLNNCVHGLDVCSNGAWTGCIDDETLSQSPDLFASLTEAR